MKTNVDEITEHVKQHAIALLSGTCAPDVTVTRYAIGVTAYVQLSIGVKARVDIHVERAHEHGVVIDAWCAPSVNWSALGSVSTQDALDYAVLIANAASFAVDLRDWLSH